MYRFIFGFVVLYVLPVYSGDITTKEEYVKEHVFNFKKDQEKPTYIHPKAVVKADPITFLDFYHEGVKYYSDQEWENCIAYFEKAIALYQDYYNHVTYCRIKCEADRVQYNPMQPENFENTHFFEGLIAKTLCLEKCRLENLEPHIPRHFYLTPEEKAIFKQRKAYQYLQLCYYREGHIQKAVSASFTALVADPTDEFNKKNFKYYNDVVQYDADLVQDLEDKKFSKYYHDGLDSYEAGDWENTILNLEHSLQMWLNEDARCRALCDSGYDQQWFPDISTATANHYVIAIRCKQDCPEEMKKSRGNIIEKVLQNHFSYLQLAYYKLNKLDKACHAIATYIFLDTTNKAMNDNYKFYKTNCTETALKPRQEIVDYVNRYMYENAILNFVDKEFTRLYNLRHHVKDLFAEGIEINVQPEVPNSKYETKGDLGEVNDVEGGIANEENKVDTPNPAKKRQRFVSLEKVFGKKE